MLPKQGILGFDEGGGFFFPALKGRGVSQLRGGVAGGLSKAGEGAKGEAEAKEVGGAGG